VIRLRPAEEEDAPAIAALYAPFVRDTAITFETEAPDAAAIRARIAAGGERHPWLAALDGKGRLLGYAYATGFRARPAYRFAVETSVYVDPATQRRGIGARLYAQLLATLTAQGFTQAIAAIALPNPASVRLHEAAGFAPSGVYRQVGYKLGAWHDVGLWQCALASAEERPAEPRPLSGLAAQSR
jgi:phosphinothricin acetyltransferase